MKQQDLVWVKLPFSNFGGSKTRPAVVLSNNSYNGQGKDVVVCAVTSKLEPRPYSITLNQENLSEGVLPLKSLIRTDKILQIEKSLIEAPFATINNETFDRLVNEAVKLLKRGKE
ncbi:type II toxin-antitoxin system PemK/MazF family toxin [Candidatus Woesearchaeota archaeon]|nr:type II toxin-antitoxin system PemK/MazF family toxin [Candidatus Woesearchaeota archaeon]